MSFTYKVVAITGAASGMGAANAVSFSKLNANLCIIDKNEKGLLRVKENCEKLTTGKVVAVIVDVSKDEDVGNMLKALTELGSVDVLVNCAGILGPGSLLDSDILDTFDKVIQINLRSVLAVTKTALPLLIKSKGCVINTSSIADSITLENSLAYSISKAGITKFTKSAAFELARFGVRVNCISPGPVRTNLLINAGFSQDADDIHWKVLAEKSPLGVCARAEEVAEMAVYLASEKAGAITGSNFVIDAGMSLGTVGDNPCLPTETNQL